MPLKPGYSREAIAQNISELMSAGRKQDVAVAIAYEKARREWKKKNPGKEPPAYLREDYAK